jgi:SAM-dependent methyltransferase
MPITEDKLSSNMYKTLSVIRGSPRYNAWLYSCISRYLNGVVLDIGSGLGDIARQFTGPGVDEVILSDHDFLMLNALGQASFPLKKYSILQLDITDPRAVSKHPGGLADTITCINVLEHIDQDETALRHMKHLLKKGGRVVIFVPALPKIYGTLDRLVDHHRRYTKRSLSTVLHKAGFIVRDGYYMNMFGIVTWFLAGRVLKQKEFHKEACHMLDKTVPALRTLESLGSPPLGQSLVMVGEVPASG